jgi:ferredoxin
MPQIDLDAKRCAGHALCHAVAERVYKLDDDGYCVLEHLRLDESLRQEAVDGAEACPERAITVVD